MISRRIDQGYAFGSSEHTMFMEIEINEMLLCLLTVWLKRFLFSPSTAHCKSPPSSTFLPWILILNHSFSFISFDNLTLDFCLGKNAIKSPLWLVFMLYNLDK